MFSFAGFTHKVRRSAVKQEEQGSGGTLCLPGKAKRTRSATRGQAEKMTSGFLESIVATSLRNGFKFIEQNWR